MHYIRFLKVPRLIRIGRDQRTLTAKITITTDLGESFLATDVVVEALLEFPSGVPIPNAKQSRHTWAGKNGMRSIEVSIAVPRKHTGLLRMSVRAVERKYADVESLQDTFSPALPGGIVAVNSMPIDIDSSHTSEALAKRRFSTNLGSISIWEETGESIARHIWDAGLVLSSYISQLSPYLKTPSTTPKILPRLPNLETLLAKPNLNILELGAGCGIVGLTFAHSLPDISTITLTDLPEATEILDLNLSPANFTPKSASTTISHQVLDWSEPLPSNISSTKWDLVLVADCTYNPDVVPDLVKTLGRVRGGSRGVVVLLAMKVRHESEMVFFDLMGESSFEVIEKCKIPLPMVDDEEGQEIEIFVFGSGKR
ncbi:uncharacterized protein PAC_11103 [Phialocephala subalpina]|uniref:Uncharacterized protein n=1 Tax=Phialocephala subalpina TaxID=576137 RepID=A0A1L7X879_9HELO|nr:uncharacterized protein PAC_11103 [Phialocephala subalpina]